MPMSFLGIGAEVGGSIGHRVLEIHLNLTTLVGTTTQPRADAGRAALACEANFILACTLGRCLARASPSQLPKGPTQKKVNLLEP